MARFQETKVNSGSDTRMMAEDRVPKARKPYMITKQREKWTEEEHKLFLEAMQLHGRAWRRIQEHIGTKTAVQIRSHAQKFFSKVTRESSGDSSNSSGAGPAIQIPPPRPKRKSVHPYPCNLRSAPAGRHVLRLEKPLVQMQSMCEQGNGSPTSVVTATSQIGLGSESFDSDTSTIDIEERCPTPSTGTAGIAVQVPTTDDAKESKGSSTSEEVVCDTSDAPVLKLFGKTVVVNDSHQQLNPGTGDLQAASDMELDASSETPTSGNGAPEASTWSPWLANSQQFMYYVPQGAVFFGYNGGSVPYPMPSSPKAVQQQQQQPSEAENELRRMETSSNTASSSVPESTTPNSAESCTEANGGDDEVAPQHVAGLRKTFVQQRGFMPYRRCAAETKAFQPQARSEEADGEMTRLCL